MTPIRTGMTITHDGERYRRVVMGIMRNGVLDGYGGCAGCAMHDKPNRVCRLDGRDNAPCVEGGAAKAVYYHYEKVVA